MAEIDKVTNYDNDYFRMVGIALCRTLSKSIRWINRFEDHKFRVLVPFYLSLTGDENFLLDAFVDDIVDKRVTLNTDKIPRGIVTLNSFNPAGDEFANPNQYLAKNVIINDELRKIVSKIKAVPMIFNYKIEITLASEIDVYKFSKKFTDTLFNYFFFNIDYFGLKLDTVLELPDDKTIEIPREIDMTTERKKKVEIPREIDMTTERKKKVEINLNVRSYYPLFRVDSEDLEICSNDDDINWSYLDIPRPTADFCESIENIYKERGKHEICNINKVFWKSYIFEAKELKNKRSLNSQSDLDYHNSLKLNSQKDQTS